MLLYMIILIGICFLSILVRSPAFLGMIGEKMIVKKLEKLIKNGYSGEILHNVYVPKEDDETTEIDVLFVTKKGIFVIESKNYSGYIFGNDHSAKWTATLYGGKRNGRSRVLKYKFYNPVWQNNTHVKYLQKRVGTDIPLYSYIVFSDRCSFKNIDVNNNKATICHRKHLIKLMKEEWLSIDDCITSEQISQIKEQLSGMTEVDKEVKEKHVQAITERFVDNTTCPKCGGKLVLRTSKKGPNQGMQFYGCENYPKCRYTKDL